jgi:hypothetical protein
MRSVIAVFAVACVSLLAGGCNSSSSPVPGFSNSIIYYTYFDSVTAGPQLAVAAYPLTNASVPLVLSGNGTNNLDHSNSVLIDASNRLWVMERPGTCCLNSRADVFAQPVTAASAPLFTITLNGEHNEIAATFDASGNLWAVAENANAVLEYAGPFTGNATLGPSKTITAGLSEPTGLAFDAAGDLFVTNFLTTGAGAVTRFNAPLTSGMGNSGLLNGPKGPAGIVFDHAGNLYVGGGASSLAPNPIVRYNAGNQGDGANPDIMDTTGILNDSYASTLVFDSAGNLYDADCGNPAKIYVFPTSVLPFSSTLAPSLVFSEPSIVSTNCVWGIAIR